MIVEVTQEDIKRGAPRSERACPIALALRRAGFEDVEVMPDLVLADGRTSGRVYSLPRSAQRFIHRLDWGDPVKPFRFRLVL